MPTTSKIIAREFVFATYVHNNQDKTKDALFVKEILHNADGRIKRNFHCIENYQRPFYVTKKEFQDHTQKKEYEHSAKLTRQFSNQAQLPRAVYKALNGYNPTGYVGLQDISSSPFLYGTDITTPVLVAKDYSRKWPNLATENTLAVMDYETD